MTSCENSNGARKIIKPDAYWLERYNEKPASERNTKAKYVSRFVFVTLSLYITPIIVYQMSGCQLWPTTIIFTFLWIWLCYFDFKGLKEPYGWRDEEWKEILRNESL